MNKSPTVPRLVATAQAFSRLAAIVVIAVGSLILLGWLFNIDAFKRIFTNLPALKFNLALCFILAGVSLLTLHTRPRLAQITAVAVLVIAGLTLCQHLFGWQLGIDQLLMRDTTISTNPAAQPGRMSVITTIILSITGGGLVIMSFIRRYLLAQIVTLIALLISLLALVGYLYNVRSLYSVESSSIALQTALTSTVLCFGMLLAFPDKGLAQIISADSAGGYLVRYALPAVALFPLLIGWLTWQGEAIGLYSGDFGAAMFTLSHMVLLSVIMLWIANKLHNADLERIRSEEAVRTLNAELEQRVRERTVHLTAIIKELDSFNYSVSHDLRSPLRAMDGYAQALLEDQANQLDDNARHYLTRIRAATQRMGSVIDDLLQLAQLSRTSIARSTVDLSRLAHEVIEELKEEYPDHNVTYSIEAAMLAQGDTRLLRIALQNLLSNAWKFTRKQSHPTVEIGTIEHEGKRAYFIRDNGVGFDMRFANKLFRAFQRLHDIQDFEGTGIGLAIVARIVQRHGGQVWAESQVDQGATFYFTV
ncbi:MAG: hypothetical protein KF716_06260 [Anaerolineae bacterium]|nr:hypothetical protein [Anaerolineae bacterium]